MDSFFENPLKDIHNVTLDKEDTDTAKRIVKMRLSMSGYDEARINKMLKTIPARIGSPCKVTSVKHLPTSPKFV
jgi:hypothetical protein